MAPNFEQLPTSDPVQLRNTLKRLVESGAICTSKAEAWAQEMADEVEAAAIREKADEGGAEAVIELRALMPYSFYFETQSSLLFRMPTPQPYPSTHEKLAGRMPSASVVNKRVRNSYDQALRNLQNEKYKFETLNTMRRAARDLNREAATPLEVHAVFSPQKPIRRKQKRGEAAERDRLLTEMAATQARMKSLKEKEKQKRQSEAQSRKARVVRYQAAHLMSTMEATTVEEIYESRAADSAREASSLMGAMREEETGEEESEGEEEESDEGSDQGDQELQEDTATPAPLATLVLPTSRGILVPVGSAVPVPQQVPAATATASAEVSVAPVDPFPAPSAPRPESSVDASQTESPAISPELEAPSSPAQPEPPVSSEPEHVSSEPELSSLEARNAELEAKVATDSARLEQTTTKLAEAKAQLREERQLRAKAEEEVKAITQLKNEAEAVVRLYENERRADDSSEMTVKDMQQSIDTLKVEKEELKLKWLDAIELARPEAEKEAQQTNAEQTDAAQAKLVRVQTHAPPLAPSSPKAKPGPRPR